MRLLLIACLFMAGIATAAETYGPYRADVVRVIDGDTIELDVAIWPDLTQRINLRISGINTPEKSPRWKCDDTADVCEQLKACEKFKAAEATAYASQLLTGQVTIDQVHLGKYASRALGRVTVNGQDFATAMINAGHAREYHGEARGPWCQ